MPHRQGLDLDEEEKPTSGMDLETGLEDDNEDDEMTGKVNRENLSIPELHRIYDEPDYIFLVKKKNEQIMVGELEDLCQRGGIYYESFEKKIQEAESDGEKIICYVVSFSPEALDEHADWLKMSCRLHEYDTVIEFKAFAH